MITHHRIRAVVVVLALLTVQACTPSFAQFYSDRFYSQDRVYQNVSLGFAVMFSAGWNIEIDVAEMNRTRRQAALSIHKQGAELIFAGETVEGGHGTRGIVENLNLENDKFVAALRNANKAGIERDLGVENFVAGDVLSIKWEYVHNGMNFAEFLFRAGTRNVRIAFWTKPELYNEFLPVYEGIMATLDLDLVQ
jgi:hypothetical protein